MSMSTETLPQMTPKPKARSLRAKTAMSPTTVRKALEDKSSNELFSPTSAAALALSSLHQFGAQRDNRAAPADTELKGTRLFVPATTAIENDNENDSSSNENTNNENTNRNDGNVATTTVTIKEEEESQKNRASPVPSLGGPYATAPMQRPPGVLQHHNHNHTQPLPLPLPPPPIAAHPNNFARLASCASTLVTPTPKKAKLSHNHPIAEPNTTAAAVSVSSAANYSRKKKSLGVLAENFLNTYQALPKGSTIVVDEAAIKLGVERRRIYDVVNILESISLVCKKHKNTYTWMGMEQLDAVFGRLQAQAIAEYPQDAKQFLGSTTSDIACQNKIKQQQLVELLPAVPLKPARKQSKSRENKSLAKLSQEFLQVFLVGHETLSLPEASDKIQGTTSVEELIAMGCSSQKTASTEKELKAAAARGLKTKIRRLYDIANVFLSVGLLRKVDRGDASRRPNFSWSYRISAKQLYQLHYHQPQQTNVAAVAAVAPSPPSSEPKTTEMAVVAVATPDVVAPAVTTTTTSLE
ncbi:MAG: hypothetical protein SGBAC_003776 [Bacillariaceae sp.]